MTIVNDINLERENIENCRHEVLLELVPWQTVHADLIGPYSITAKQYQTDGSIIDKELSLTCMAMIDPVIGWFEIVEVPREH